MLIHYLLFLGLRMLPDFVALSKLPSIPQTVLFPPPLRLPTANLVGVGLCTYSSAAAAAAAASAASAATATTSSSVLRADLFGCRAAWQARKAPGEKEGAAGAGIEIGGGGVGAAQTPGPQVPATEARGGAGGCAGRQQWWCAGQECSGVSIMLIDHQFMREFL